MRRTTRVVYGDRAVIRCEYNTFANRFSSRRRTRSILNQHLPIFIRAIDSSGDRKFRLLDELFDRFEENSIEIGFHLDPAASRREVVDLARAPERIEPKNIPRALCVSSGAPRDDYFHTSPVDLLRALNRRS